MKKILICTSILLSVLYCIHVRNLNLSETVKTIDSRRVVYAENAEVVLPNEMYYIDYADLSGYSINVTETELLDLDLFLAQYNISRQDLQSLSEIASLTDFTRYGYVYLITVEFYNSNWNKESTGIVLLDNFLLVGPDYYVWPNTEAINCISGFNPELNGSASFALVSDRVLKIQIPYLIDTETEYAISPSYLLESEPKLLLGFYPEEIYLELPEPLVSY